MYNLIQNFMMEMLKWMKITKDTETQWTHHKEQQMSTLFLSSFISFPFNVPCFEFYIS